MKKILFGILLALLLLIVGFLVFINTRPSYPYPEKRAMSAADSLINREFKVQVLELKNTYDGPAVATLVHRPADSSQQRAVLYIHGYGDYFFQRHLARWYNDRGFDFYGLDLRRYGRSWLTHQQPNYVRALTEYFEEIDRAVQVIRQQGPDHFLLLNGHSTGGLIASLYCDAGPGRGEIDGLFLNSPFLDFNAPRSMERAIEFFAWLGRWQPRGTVAGGDESMYTKTLHEDYFGRWDFNTNWKPLESFPVTLGWLRAIEHGHSRIEDRLDIECPILVLHSDHSSYDKSDIELMQRTDAVLDVREIHERAPWLGDDVEVRAVPGTVHDVFLSDPAALEGAYDALGEWLERFQKNG